MEAVVVVVVVVVNVVVTYVFSSSLLHYSPTTFPTTVTYLTALRVTKRRLRLICQEDDLLPTKAASKRVC